MLFRFDGTDHPLEPLPFLDFAEIGKLEIDLEHLLARNLWGVLFEDDSLFPFFRERSLQPEADIYAIDRAGNLVIFELKRGAAGKSALEQLLRYYEEAAQWKYEKLSENYDKFLKSGEESTPRKELAEAHQEALGLQFPLRKEEFNQRQKLYVVGHAADGGLRRSVQFWQSKSMDVEFLPYRLYRIGEGSAAQLYLEFFAKPLDVHINPAHQKGVLFDTNLSYRPDGLQWMLDRNRVSAWYIDAAKCFRRGDIVFYSVKSLGVAAVGIVKSDELKSDPEHHELYKDVEVLSAKPTDYSTLKCISFKEASEITGRSFYHARTAKVPFLSLEESEKLRAAVIKRVGRANG